MADGYDASQTVALSSLNNQTFFDEVNAYAEKVREKGATPPDLPSMGRM